MADFYTGQLRLARLCVLRSLMKRPSVSFLRRAASYKGLRPLRCFAAIRNTKILCNLLFRSKNDRKIFTEFREKIYFSLSSADFAN